MALGADERGVSNVVGATLIFGFLVIFLALYQATVVPSQNEQVEFDHSQAVQRDVVDVRNAILDAKETGQPGHVSVTLGTTYPARTIAINPPPVTGNLRTTPNESFAIRDGSGSLVTGNVCPGDAVTRRLAYAPSYHVYASGPDVVYENSVVYERFGTGNVFASGQTLVRGDSINVVPLQGNYSRSGMKTVAFEPRAGQLDTTEVDQPEIELPTALSESDWEELLDGEVAAENVTVADGNVTIDPAGEYTVNCGPVGAGSVPSGGPRSADRDINPAGPGDVKLDGSRTGSGDSAVEVDFNNTADSATNLTVARISFYFKERSGGSKPSQAVLYNASDSPAAGTTLVVGSASKPLDPEIRLPPNRVTTLVFEYDQTVKPGDFFVVEVTYLNGKTGTYFVAPQ